MDLSELGNGTQDSAPLHESRASEADSRFAERKRKKLDNLKQWRLNNPTKVAEAQAAWAARNRERRNKYARDRVALFSPEKKAATKAYQKAYRLKNKERLKAVNRDWVSRNQDRLKKKSAEYLPRRLRLNAERRRLDPAKRITDAARTRVKFLLRHHKASTADKTFDLIGCTPRFFADFIKSQLSGEMTWENYGSVWEVDHIIPVTAFNLLDRGQLNAAFHYSNCRPLLKPLNRAKGDRLPGPHQPLLV